MDQSELRALITRLRRQTTSRDTLDLCDAAMELLGKSKAKEPFDRKTYMRDYMRQRRAKPKTAPIS